MNITIQINTDGEAFSRFFIKETIRVLEVVREIIWDNLGKSGNSTTGICDSLGNRCGTVTITEEPSSDFETIDKYMKKRITTNVRFNSLNLYNFFKYLKTMLLLNVLHNILFSCFYFFDFCEIESLNKSVN